MKYILIFVIPIVVMLTIIFLSGCGGGTFFQHDCTQNEWLVRTDCK